MSSIAVIDYGMGNLHSIGKALQHVCQDEIIITGDPHTILSADRVVLPGVGAIRDCIGQMRQHGVAEVAVEAARSKPFLGICVGMQALLTASDENGGVDCLNLFSGRFQHFSPATDSTGAPLKIPHMGWNQVQQVQAHALWRGIPQNSRFYFVHSYYLPVEPFAHAAGVTDYANPFVAALSRDNIFAVQFHPEKSQTVGLALLQNFTRWQGA